MPKPTQSVKYQQKEQKSSAIYSIFWYFGCLPKVAYFGHLPYFKEKKRSEVF